MENTIWVRMVLGDFSRRPTMHNRTLANDEEPYQTLADTVVICVSEIKVIIFMDI